MLKPQILWVSLILATVAGCDKPAPPVSQARPVRTVVVERHAEGEIVSLTGQVRAKDQANLGFRLDGRVIERLVNLGDAVKPGQVLARLDPRSQQDLLHTAQADLLSAEAVLTQARLTFARQQELLKDGWTPRAKFDEAQQSLATAEAQVASAKAKLSLAQNELSYTVLFADGPGIVTAVGAEPGEVVSPGRMVVQVAREGGRDAIFDAPEQLILTAPHDSVVDLALSDNPQITATGRVREVAPQAAATTRTFEVKVGIINPPAAMRLGATVTGRIRLAGPAGVELPASALTEANGNPAVWVVDPKSLAVSLRTVAVAQHGPATVVISQGLDTGELVVTAGVQTLHPGQKVRLLGDA
ncbi:MAG: efflux RND transporter periplasmic adaptor subunit [Alphaproteobacteria bacterium]|nr:efflux RND transporter periplasmic adaptor subunit [Alphaproteobacteria bacterium]